MTFEEDARLALALYRIGAVRIGDFVLKDGRHSPFYIDLRLVIGYPSVLRQLAGAMLRVTATLQYDCLAGIPYAGLPLAVAMSLQADCPLVYPRKETKSYGTQKQVEGVFTSGQRALVVDDVVTTGGAKLEAIRPLREAGLAADDIVVVVDREQGGSEALAREGLRVHRVLGVRRLLQLLHDQELLAPADLQRALDFVAA